MSKWKTNRCLLIGTLSFGMFLFPMSAQAISENNSVDGGIVQQRRNVHDQEVAKMEQQWQVLHLAYRFEKEGYLDKAAVLFEKALKMDDQNVPRNALARLYEKTGRYEKALEQVEWFLRGNQNEQGRKISLADQQRLLQKIEAQKRGKKIEESKLESSGAKVIHSVADFETASYADQKEYLEKKFPEDMEILRLSKQALLAEHAGKFADAKGYYEQLLSRKEDVTAAQGDVAWPMLHCAVQRASELTGDEAREKEMLVWIKAYMLEPQGPFHSSVEFLMPDVIDHLNKQIKKYQL